MTLNQKTFAGLSQNKVEKEEKKKEVGEDLSACVLLTSSLRLNQNKELEWNWFQQFKV